MRISELLAFGDDALSGRLRAFIHSVGRVHGVPSLPRIPVVISRARREEGSYHYESRTSRAIRIDISRFAVCVEWTLAHEVGHCLDHLGLNPIKRGFGSDHDPIFDALIHQWRATGPVQVMGTALNASRRRLGASERRMVRDYLSPRELWARTYVQWFAMKCGDARLVSHLNVLRREGVRIGGKQFDLQWGEEEFADILPVVDELMESAGLL